MRPETNCRAVYGIGENKSPPVSTGGLMYYPVIGSRRVPALNAWDRSGRISSR